VTSWANRILDENGDVDAALANVERQAQFTDFVRENRVAITAEIKKARLSPPCVNRHLYRSRTAKRTAKSATQRTKRACGDCQPVSPKRHKLLDLKGEGWYARRDSNAGPSAPEADALSS
jgi:hypothetical protein